MAPLSSFQIYSLKTLNIFETPSIEFCPINSTCSENLSSVNDRKDTQETLKVTYSKPIYIMCPISAIHVRLFSI